jgi:hypothetical protein
MINPLPYNLANHMPKKILLNKHKENGWLCFCCPFFPEQLHLD